MVRSRILLIGTVVSLASGAFVALAMADDLDESLQRVDVPLGRIGDEVAYAAFQRNVSTEEWTEAEGWSFRVEGMNATRDKAGTVRGALVVATWAYAGPWATWPWPEPIRFAFENWGLGLRFDLETRHPIAWEFHDSGRYHLIDSRITDYAYDWKVTEFQRVGRDFGSDWYLVGPLSYVYEHQGRRYEIDEAPAPPAFLPYATDEPEAVTWLSMESSVHPGGLVEELRTLRLFTKGCANVAPAATPYETIMFLHAEVPRPSEVCVEINTWFNDTVAYPVLHHERLVVNGKQSHEWLETLVRVVAGDQEIGWHVPPVERVWNPPAIERSPSGPGFPTQGSARWPSFTLDEALAAIGGDVTLSAFRTWQTQNHDYRVLGFSYGSDQTECAGGIYRVTVADNRPTWEVVYGNFGKYFTVLSQRNPTTGLVTNCERGAQTGGVVPLEWLPMEPATFAAALDRWGTFFPDLPLDRGYLSWGMFTVCAFAHYNAWDAGVYPAGAPYACTPGTATWLSPQTKFLTRDHFERLYVARLPPLGVSGNASGLDGYVRLYLDLRDGTVLNYREYEEGPEVVQSIEPVPPGEPLMASEPATDAPQIPSLLLGGAVGASIFLVFLLVYLLPTLKQLGAYASGWLPQYAKLRKDAILANTLREQITNLVAADPGLDASRIHERIGGGWSTVVYHLSVLEKNRVVTSVRNGRHRRYFVPQALTSKERSEIAVLKNEASARVFGIVKERPGITRADLARRLGMTKAGVIFHMERLAKAGLVTDRRDGPKATYWLAARS